MSEEGEQVFKYKSLIQQLQQRQIQSILIELDDIAKVSTHPSNNFSVRLPMYEILILS